ncbi:MAG: amidohydrolase family protein, partial [Microbacteriaceae bacterium]|nr:amidohydrolase family protein [Microbacteriaceae bacterium]
RHLEPGAEPLLPDERIVSAAAFAAYTQGIAAQALTPDRGTLQIGQVADAVWLSGNPIEVPATQIPELTVRATWLSGERTF